MKYIQINILLNEGDIKILDQIMQEDGHEKRSPYLRQLIRREFLRRLAAKNALIAPDRLHPAGEPED